ncbi:hypothetical protein L6R52_23890 [Myxococcota bacterium]|nr:hypothetical protein [Myxococcota bacterium]
MGPSDRRWARDPWVWAGALFGAAATAWAVFAGPYLPYIDWGAHLGLISVLAHGGDTGALDFFTRSWLPSPYLLFYALTALFAQAVPVDVAAKLVLVVTSGALALGASSLAAATGRSPRMGMVAPLAMFGVSMGWGFGSFVVATPIFFFVLAAAERVLAALDDPGSSLDVRDLPSPRRAAIAFASWLALLYLAHGFAFFVALLVVGLRTLVHAAVRARRSLADAVAPIAVLAAAVVPSVLIALPAAILLVRTPSIEAGSDPNAALVEWTPLGARLAGLGGDLLERGSAYHWWVMWGAVALFAIWSVVSLFRPHRDARPRTTFGLELYALLLVALYLFGPMSVSWPSSIWMIYPRFGVIAALALVLVPRPDLRGRGLPLALAGLVLVGANAHLNARHVGRYNAWASTYDGVRALVPRGARVLALTVPAPDEPKLEHSALGSLYMYLMVDGASYVAFLFDKNELPVHLRRDRPAPRAPLWNQPSAYDPKTHGVDYDYLVLRGRPIVERTERAGLHEKIGEAGPWSVWRTKAPTPRTLDPRE